MATNCLSHEIHIWHAKNDNVHIANLHISQMQKYHLTLAFHQPNSKIGKIWVPYHILISFYKYLQILFFIGGYVFPLLLIIGMYSVMLRRLWKQGPGGHASAESIRNKKRVIKMILIVIVIFALWWLPIHLVLVLRYSSFFCFLSFFTFFSGRTKSMMWNVDIWSDSKKSILEVIFHFQR